MSLITRITAALQQIGIDIGSHTGATNNPHGVTKAQVGLGNVDNTSDAAKPISTATANALANKADLSGGKIPTSQLPDSVLGGVQYQGTWNASTGTPTIPAASSSNKGHYYRVSVAGSTNIDGIAEWKPGDWIVSNGSTWDKIDNSEAVTSVAGKSGAVTLAKGDVGLGNVDNTSDANKPVSGPQQTALNAKIDSAAIGDPETNLLNTYTTARDTA